MCVYFSICKFFCKSCLHSLLSTFLCKIHLFCVFFPLSLQLTFIKMAQLTFIKMTQWSYKDWYFTLFTVKMNFIHCKLHLLFSSCFIDVYCELFFTNTTTSRLLLAAQGLVVWVDVQFLPSSIKDYCLDLCLCEDMKSCIKNKTIMFFVQLKKIIKHSTVVKIFFLFFYPSCNLFKIVSS